MKRIALSSSDTICSKRFSLRFPGSLLPVVSIPHGENLNHISSSATNNGFHAGVYSRLFGMTPFQYRSNYQSKPGESNYAYFN